MEERRGARRDRRVIEEATDDLLTTTLPTAAIFGGW